MRLPVAILALAVIALLGADTAGAQSRPAAVDRARASVIRVIKTSDDLKSVAVAVNDKGDFLTTSQAVSRSPGLRVLIPGNQRAFSAVRVPSDAKPGFELIHVNGAPAVKPAKFADRTPAADSMTWVVAPSTVLLRPRRGRVLVPEQLCTDGADADLVSIGVSRAGGMNGSPVLDRKGRVLGLVRPNRSPGRGCTDEGVQVLLTGPVPQRLPAVAPPQRSDFPAVPVVIGLGLLLILANVALLVRRRRSLGEPEVATAGTEPELVPVDAGAGEDEWPQDELQITLRPKPDYYR